MGTIHQLRDSLYNFVSGLGTAKDARMAAVYSFEPLDKSQLEVAFRSDWIARKVITAPAEDATREWREWQASQPQIEKLEEAEKKFKLQQKMEWALTLARLYGGSAFILGVDIGKAEEELNYEDVGQDDLKFIEVFHQFELTPGQRIRDIMSPWFNQPEYYMLGSNTTNLDGDKRFASGIQIHPSRVVPIIGNMIPDIRSSGEATWGDSVLQTVDEAIKATETVIGGIASMVNDAKMDVVHVPGLTNKLADADARDKLISRFQLANKSKSIINTLLLDEKETWERTQTAFGSLPQLLQEYLTIAAGASGIPVSRLLGQAKGKGIGGTEGGGEVDTRNYYDGISSIQRNKISPAITVLDEVFIRSTLGSNDESIYYDWTPLWQLSDTEKAAIALQKAQATQVDVTSALINPDALRQARVNQLIEDGTYPGLDDAIDEHGMEPPEPETPSPEDVQAHIGMMQQSAGQLQKIGKAAGLAPPNPQDSGGWLDDAWLRDDKDKLGHGSNKRGVKGKVKPEPEPDDNSGGPFDKTWYHGTTSEILDDISKNGITVGADKRVWIASNKSTASFFAETKASEGAHPVVFEVNVPKNEAKTFKAMNFDKTHSTASSEHKIPPSWIAGYHLVDKKTGKMTGGLKRMPRATKDAAAPPPHPQLTESPHLTHYIVVLAKGDDVTDAWSDAARAAALDVRRRGGATPLDAIKLAHAAQENEMRDYQEAIKEATDPKVKKQLQEELSRLQSDHATLKEVIKRKAKAGTYTTRGA